MTYFVFFPCASLLQFSGFDVVVFKHVQLLVSCCVRGMRLLMPEKCGPVTAADWGICDVRHLDRLRCENGPDSLMTKRIHSRSCQQTPNFHVSCVSP